VQDCKKLAPTSDAKLDQVFNGPQVANRKEEPDVLPDQAVEQHVVQENNFSSDGHTQDTQVEFRDAPDPATASIADENPAEAEGTIKAEPLPSDADAVHDLHPISPEAKGSSDGKQSASLLKETAAGPSNEQTGTLVLPSTPLKPPLVQCQLTFLRSARLWTMAVSTTCWIPLVPPMLDPRQRSHASESSSSEDDVDVSHTLDVSLTYSGNAKELSKSASDAHLFDLQPSRAVRSDF
jgi:hypothetical protein